MSEKQILKEPTPVLIYLTTCKIRGKIYLDIEQRLTDYINDSKITFLPVTDARIESISPTEDWQYEEEFLNVNKNYIVTIIPLNENAISEKETRKPIR